MNHGMKVRKKMPGSIQLHEFKKVVISLKVDLFSKHSRLANEKNKKMCKN